MSFSALNNCSKKTGIHAARLTCHTRIKLSVYPANRVWPSADHANEIQSAGLALPLRLITSGLRSSTTDFDSKSHILMLGPEAAHSQYRFGLKVRVLIMSPPSRVYKCLPSFRSHSIAFPSLPPEAHKEPSGDTVTVFTYPV